MTLNLFPSTPRSDDIFDLRTQRISTRVFMVVFFLSFYILLIYASTTKDSKTITVSHPDLQQYHRLHSKYPRTLACSCSQISVSFNSFIQINYSLHHICRSFFVSNAWITFLGYSVTSIRLVDFRVIGRQQFQGLRSLCQLAEESIQTSLVQFYSNSYVNALTTSSELLLSQMNATIEQFISSTTNNFLLSLRMIGNTTQVNALLSAELTNYLVVTSTTQYMQVASKSYDNGCYCNSRNPCASRAMIYDTYPLVSGWYVPGFYIGCFILEAFRYSRLECLYNATCLNLIRYFIGYPVSTNLMPLNASLSKRFTPQTSIGVIIDALMVEEWHWNISHDDYYNACKPKQCSYTLNARKDTISIVTMLLSLIGGLVTALKLIVPRFVQVIRWYFKPKTTPQSLSGT